MPLDDSNIIFERDAYNWDGTSVECKDIRLLRRGNKSRKVCKKKKKRNSRAYLKKILNLKTSTYLIQKGRKKIGCGLIGECNES